MAGKYELSNHRIPSVIILWVLFTGLGQVAKVRGYHINFPVAGMPNPLFYKKTSNTGGEIKLHSTPLGTFSGFAYPETIRKSVPGDVVLMMSDGLPELFNLQQEQMGDARIKEYFLGVCKRKPQEIIDYFAE